MSTKRKRELEAKLKPDKKKAALLCVEAKLGEDSSQRLELKEIAKRVGVTEKCLWQWRSQNPDFIEYHNILCNEILCSMRGHVYQNLMKLIDPKGANAMGSVKAIELYLKLHGLLTDRQVVETKEVHASTSTEDIEKEIEQLGKELDATKETESEPEDETEGEESWHG